MLVFHRWSLDGGSGVAVLGGRSGSDSQPFTRTELRSFIFTLSRALYCSPRPICVLFYAPMCCFGVYCLRSSPPLPQPFQNSDGPCLYFVSVTFLQGKPFRRLESAWKNTQKAPSLFASCKGQPISFLNYFVSLILCFSFPWPSQKTTIFRIY